ncbi:MAG: M23 family metallopeptidase [Bacteroidales bacterium]|nr:M23 family metallopeptidase [Bacteroidales bacterium]
MKKSCLFLAVLLFPFVTFAQTMFPKYGKPVDIPIYLSATFAELRPNHLHAGIDIKTQAVEGKKVYAVADGYVSRIGVSPYGYGNVLYITHYDGYTSVYGHLQRFNGEIAKYVKDYQYANKTFAAQIYPGKDKFRVKKGDVIAYSGNSGGSGGPHLHFEIRHTESEKPVNPLFFGYQIEDNVKPLIQGFAIYPLNGATLENAGKAKYYSVTGQNGKYSLKDRTLVTANGEIAFGISTYDQVGTSTNKNGPYSYELYLDGDLRFKVEADSFSYSEPRYVNSLLDYAHYKEVGSSYVRTIIDPYNKLKMIKLKNGIVDVAEGDTVSVCFKVRDYVGNASHVDFKLIGTKPAEIEAPIRRRSEYLVMADGSMNSEITIENFNVTMEKGTFFCDEYVNTGQRDEDGCCSRIFRFGDDRMTTFKNFKVRIIPNDEWVDDSRLYVAYINNKEKVSSLGGKMVKGAMEVETRNLGEFTLKIDSIAPTITPSNFKNGQSVAELKSLRFKISDDMTGVDSYNIYLNDKWVLGQYDAKNDLLYYEFDSHAPAGSINVKVVVKDGVGNKKTYTAKVVR